MTTVERPRLLLTSSGTQVLLVGSGTYAAGSRLTDVAAVPRTISDLGGCLIDRAGLDPSNLVTLVDPADPREFGTALVQTAKRARDVLVVYYVGHGLVSMRKELHLATRSTIDLTQGIPSHQAVPYSIVREVLSECPARLVLVILDCCFSGRAQGSTVRADVDEAFDTAQQGMYLLTSTSRDEAAWAPEDQPHTAFSGALINLLTTGDPAAPPLLTLDHLYRSLARTLTERGFPRPRRQAADYADQQPIAPNPAYRNVPEKIRQAQDRTGDFSPYRGLAAFGPEDADFFFGRADLTATLVRRVLYAPSHTGPLVVIGPSGSGKSSLLRAGLIPALLRASDRGEPDAGFMVLSPGDDPVGVLAKRFSSLAALAPGQPQRRLEADPAALRQILEGVPRSGAARPIIIVDQFEEIFTACPDENQRLIFIRALQEASCDRTGPAPAVVVVAVRADFYAHCTAHPELLNVLDHPVVVGPMTAAQLREAIERPAALAGLVLQDGLVDLLLDDVGAGAQAAGATGGVLPLLSHALLSTWHHREGRTLTLAGYRASGGIARSLAQTADGVLEGLPPASRQTARWLLPRLVRVGEGTEDTRRRAQLADLIPSAGSPGYSPARQILDHFVRARLVTTDEDMVEITHEALIRAWPRLRSWVEADRAILLALQQLDEDANTWLRHDRDAAFLYQGTRLATAGEAARRWEADPSRREFALNEVQRAFLDASRTQTTRRNRRRKAITASLVALLITALAAAGFAESQRRTANEQTALAEEQRDLALAPLVAARADSLRHTDPVRGMLLSIAAWRIARVPAAQGSLYGALDQVEQSVATIPADAAGYEFRRNASTVVTFGSDGGNIWDSASGRRVRTLNVPGSDVATPTTWASATGESFNTFALSPDGNTLALVTKKGRVRLYDAGSGKRVGAEFGSGIKSVRFSPGGKWLILDKGQVEANNYVLEAWDVARQAVIHHTQSSRRLFAVSPDDRVAAYTGMNQDTVVWDLLAGKQLFSLGKTSFSTETNTESLAIAFSPDGRYLALGRDHGGGPRLWNLSDGSVVQDQNGNDTYHGGSIQALRFSADGRFLAGFDSERSLHVWRTADHLPLLVYRPAHEKIFDFGFDADAGALRLLAEGGAVLTLDLRALTHPLPVKGAYMIRDGSILLSEGDTATTLLDPRTRKVVGSVPAGFDNLEVGSHGRTMAVQRGAELTFISTAGKVTVKLPGRPPAGDWVNFVYGMAISPEGTMVAVITEYENDSGRQTVLLYDVASGRLLHTAKIDATPGSAGLMAFQPGGRLLALGTFPGRVLDVRSGKLLPGRFGPESDHMLDMAFSPDGRVIATAGVDGQVTFWDAGTLKRAGLSLPGHPGSADSLAFSARGRLLAVSGDDGVRIWDSATRQQLGPVLTTVGGNSMALAPDGSALYTTGLDENEEAWFSDFPTDPERAATALCARLRTTLTPAEWRRLIPEAPYRDVCPVRS
ncbi:AAA family ATPase [Microbispora sp. NPDC046933]|uniref:caspase, EACC1-associated type n=1 Tax=Microbispora sp. NPDC046933 TaxID=3155618 RepID=UPI0033D0B042